MYLAANQTKTNSSKEGPLVSKIPLAGILGRVEGPGEAGGGGGPALTVHACGCVGVVHTQFR